jgi:hypothetical protein
VTLFYFLVTSLHEVKRPETCVSQPVGARVTGLLGSVANPHPTILYIYNVKYRINKYQFHQLCIYITVIGHPSGGTASQNATARRIQASLCEGPLIPMTTELPAWSYKIQKVQNHFWPADRV